MAAPLRSIFRSHAHIAVFAVVFGTTLGCERAAPPPATPHVIVYLVDTLRADRLGCYGYPGDTSPFIDELASRSVVFEQAMSQGPWTVPSVVSLLTSTYPPSHGIHGLRRKLPEDVETLPEQMRAAGYRTAAFTQSPFAGSATGLDQGYDELFERPLRVDKTNRQSATVTSQQIFDWLGEQKERQDEPLFLYIHTTEPHWPLNSLERSLTGTEREELAEVNRLLQRFRHLVMRVEKNERLKAELPQLQQELEARRDAIHRYYDLAVREADDNFRAVASALDEAGYWENAIVILVADHGEEMLEHGYWLHDQSLHGELVHVPLIVKLPDGREHPASRIAAPAQLVDVYPTVLDLLGLAIPDAAQGRSLLPAIRGEVSEETRPAISVRSHEGGVDPQIYEMRGNHETSLIDDDWKLIVHHDLGSASLFDRRADPGEQRDLADAHTDRVERMKKDVDAFRAWQKSVRPTDPEPLELTEDQVQQLRRLGYVE